ncbi:PREDICTED: probable LRR receptor-like serine/threonine-protein kinase PAM74 isoform X1 [Brassica oleracea var. oleracea]|uniref:probable LRR receptor-like serine/threonine-protein kinase PAM74 isoform X1 n=1 Tax=Brassica oleracea var. oleracea TaxID=109376 RepID=UPI0006A6CC5D|nr:PREDICTED: probable LRR receptor-like serine/threonine-protein kinase PAM74 isoform X1 [Brassica oleracea var. oleracea]
MDSFRWLLLLLLLGAFSIVRLVRAQDQQGFISLDCGLPITELSPYTEPFTELRFSSDATFIKTGKSGKIQANLVDEYLKPYTSLRYFPEERRNCYSLSVDKNRKYLIRAGFVYGNYDGLNSNPEFDLHLGPNLWATIDFHNFVNGTMVEIIHTTTSNLLQVCLVKTGTTTPLISALELRPLDNDSYSTKSDSLRLFARIYLNETEGYLRYPDDAYDRRWLNFFLKSWSQISTTLEVSNDNDYDPPKKALAAAATPSNASGPLTISWTPANPGDQYYLYSHFAEIQDLQDNDTREFDLLWNGVVSTETIIPSKLEINTLLDTPPETCGDERCRYQLIKTSRSTLPPLLNALEIYTVIKFPQSETNENDGMLLILITFMQITYFFVLMLFTSVVAIKNIEGAYELSRITWQGDPCVPQQYAWDGLNCSNTESSTPPRITSLNLSSAGLTGTIAAAIQNLTKLEKLDLSNNKLTGVLPEFLVQMKSLVNINLSGNDLYGHIPQALRRKGLELLVDGNPRLCLSGSCIKDSNKKLIVIVVVSVAALVISVVVLVLVLVLKKKKSSSVEALQLPPSTPMVNDAYANSSEPSIEMKKRRFTYSEVMKMTNNFQRVVGEGGFGVVSHGTLNGSEQVAVKILSQSSSQGYKHFKAEIDLLLRVHHTNLVSLVGYCDEGDHLALIYEFMPNGDLRQHLSGKRGGSFSSWANRLRIALEAALGLEYLHFGCTPPIVHRDIKTTNILLDEQLKAKLADFGLSRSFPVGGETHVSTVVAGTPGYLDPEYYRTSRLGEKSDVYSFGIVLLEMITNQPVIDQSRQKSHITQWVGFMLNRGDITKIMDPNLHKDYESRSVWRAIELAMSCVNPSSVNRPNMSQVANELKECLVPEKSKNMDSQSSHEVSMSFDTGILPRAR